MLAKGVSFPESQTRSAADTFPTGTTLLDGDNGPRSCERQYGSTSTRSPATSCATRPASTAWASRNSSQGGGGIFVHAWDHNLQIANNRVNNNAGTLSGGINIGQGEFPPAYLAGRQHHQRGPWLLPELRTSPTRSLPYCHNLNVNVHNNSITSNSSTGDELFSATPAGAGGISFCTGSDYYKFNYNWVCGNLSTGDGGGFGHLGFSYNGDIEHNTIIFNQSPNPTIPDQRRRNDHHGSARCGSHRASAQADTGLPGDARADRTQRRHRPAI